MGRLTKIYNVLILTAVLSGCGLVGDVYQEELLTIYWRTSRFPVMRIFKSRLLLYLAPELALQDVSFCTLT